MTLITHLNKIIVSLITAEAEGLIYLFNYWKQVGNN